MKERLVSEIKKHILFLFFGTVYLLWLLITGIYIPCPFKMITGLYCPGCGISHMIVSLLHLDILSAFKYNPFLFITLPFVTINYLLYRIRYIRTGENKKCGKVTIAVEYTMLVLAVIFWILRNLSLIQNLTI